MIAVITKIHTTYTREVALLMRIRNEEFVKRYDTREEERERERGRVLDDGNSCWGKGMGMGRLMGM